MEIITETDTKTAVGDGSIQGRGVGDRFNRKIAGDENVVAVLYHPPPPPHASVIVVFEILILGWDIGKAEDQEQLPPPSNKKIPKSTECTPPSQRVTQRI